LRNTKRSCITSETIFDLADLEEQIRRIETEMGFDGFWSEPQQAQQILGKLNRLKQVRETFQSAGRLCEEVHAYLELLSGEVTDPELESECEEKLKACVEAIDDLELKTYLNGKYDASPCVMTINAGAGGTDAQDWAQMLFRMYARWIEDHHFQCEVVDQMFGEEAGLKSATMMIDGPMAYGLLKNEIGVHRLVRLSPFNANHKRQTSFAAVDVIPQISPDEFTIEIQPQDLKIDTFRASGAGGQHVNKTDSAVRVTHLPTGLVVASQNSRSQLSNKETALKILKTRLQLLQEENFKEKMDELRNNSKLIAWGNQIRSYFLHPYTLVKDHRSDFEDTDADRVLDGHLDPFIRATLIRKSATV